MSRKVLRIIWDNARTEFIPFLDYDVEIRQVICSTNAIESLNARYRRAVTARGYFPNEQAALTCFYLVTRSLDPTGQGRARWVVWWKPAPPDAAEMWDLTVDNDHDFYIVTTTANVLVHNCPSSLGRGSTGRTSASNLKEQLAMEQAQSNPGAGRVLTDITMNDSRWPATDGWVNIVVYCSTRENKLVRHGKGKMYIIMPFGPHAAGRHDRWGAHRPCLEQYSS